MQQVVQDIRTGITAVREIPDPIAPAGHVVVANVASLISAGTERYVVELAKKSLLGKARERPDHVRRVLQKMRQEGVLTTLQQVQAKLDEPMPLGYSSAGVVLACGRGVQELKPGDRVACAAPHAGVVAVGKNLCARIPDEVSFEQAAYTSVASIALEGVRLARVNLGERVLVIGLGLIGQLTIGLLKASGCCVFGIDLDPAKVKLARELGADEARVGSARDAIMEFSRGHGVDAVLITAATESNEPIELAADVARVKGRIVLVGVAGLQLPRPPFFQKELEFTVSSSLGPGRNDPQYEERGIDYPIGQARWTAQRNMRAVLDLMAQGHLPTDRLTTHRFPIERAAEAYELVTTGAEPITGIVLTYPGARAPTRRRVDFTVAKPIAGRLGVSVVGAGNFARLILLPLIRRSKDLTLRGLCTARGLNAVSSGEQHGFAFASTDLDEVLKDESTHAVFLLTRHDLHAAQVEQCLRAGKHVFVEKPLAITPDELASLDACVQSLGTRCPILMTGFNRRFADATLRMRAHFEGDAPLSVTYRFAPGPIPKSAWPQDEDVGGGRIIGEACHAIDTCTALVASPPVRVFAESVAMVGSLETTDDRVFMTLRHANGATSSIAYQAGGDRGGPTERIEIFGGGKTATLEGWDTLELWAGGKAERTSLGKNKGHKQELVEFFRVCRDGGAWPIPWDHLYGVTWASMMAVQSLREGVPFDAE